MSNQILGLHHITAIATDARRNFDFYTRVLGLRLVKKTVNFDDPGTYHFYYGNETGLPGTILTFFPWEGIQRGRTGTGMATEIGFSVPKGSLDFWQHRLSAFGTRLRTSAGAFGEPALRVEDPDGLVLNLVEPANDDNRLPWTTASVDHSKAIRGFHSVTLTVRHYEATARILTDIFGYELINTENNVSRLATNAVSSANLVDIIEENGGQHGINAGGTNHHIAFRVKDDNVLMAFRDKIRAAGLNITEKIDRNYFYSLYFREPNGILFELASDNPGFEIDEPVEQLGTRLMLPAQYESSRGEIERVLPNIGEHPATSQ